MADAQRTIDLIFNGIDNTGKAVQGALGNVEGFSRNIASVTAPAAEATFAILKFEAALLALGTVLGGVAISKAAAFESSLADLNKVLGEGDNLGDLADSARELSEQYGVASAEIVQSIANFRQAGFTAKEAAQLTKSGLDLVIAGGVEAARASDLLVASLKGFGAEAGASTAIVDLLNQVSNEYAVSVDQLLEGFATFSPIAKSAGLSLQETIGILTPGIEVFRSGSEVANALRTAFLRLQDDSKPVQQALKQLGVAQKDANGELRSGRDIFFDVAEALNGVDDNQRAYIASQLVGIQRSSQFLAVTDGLDKSLRIAGEGFQFVGSAAKEVDIQLATFENTANRLSAVFSNLLIDIGTPLLDDFGGVADALGEIFKALGDSFTEGELSSSVDFIEAEFARLAEILLGIADALPEALSQADISGFENGLTALRDAIAGLFGGLDLTNADDLATAIEFVVDSFEGLSRFSAGAIQGLEPLVTFFFDLAQEATASADAAQDVGRAFGSLTVLNTVANLFGGVSAAVNILIGLLIANQGASLLSAVKTLSTTAIPALIAILTGPAGVAVGALTAGAALGVFINKLADAQGITFFRDLGSQIADFFFKISGNEFVLDKLLEDLDRFPQRPLGESIIDADPFVQGLNEIVRGLTGFKQEVADTQALDNFVQRLGDLGSADVATRLNAQFRVFKETGQILDSVNDDAKDLAATLLTYPSDIRPASQALEQLGADGQRLDGTFSVISSGAEKAATSIDLLKNASDDLRAKAVVATIEGAAAINIAQIEADADVAVAAFESISVAIESTGKTLTDLYGLLGDENISKLDKLSLKDDIAEENRRREEAFRLEKRLVNEQIKLLRERVAALRSGGATIKISAEGLQPHLEAIWFDILEALQVRVNADGFDLLLGLDPP